MRTASTLSDSLSLSLAFTCGQKHDGQKKVVVFDICVGFGPEMLFGNSFLGKREENTSVKYVNKCSRLESIYLMCKLVLLLPAQGSILFRDELGK